jgi:hypothetical protein
MSPKLLFDEKDVRGAFHLFINYTEKVTTGDSEFSD